MAGNKPTSQCMLSLEACRQCPPPWVQQDRFPEKCVLWSKPHSECYFTTGFLSVFNLLLSPGLSIRGATITFFLLSGNSSLNFQGEMSFPHAQSFPFLMSCCHNSLGLLCCRLWRHIFGRGRPQQSGHPDRGPGRWHLQGLLLPHRAWGLHRLHQIR